VLPPDYYALAEQRASEFESDILALEQQVVDPADDESVEPINWLMRAFPSDGSE
jgi:hypothetical protein